MKNLPLDVKIEKNKIAGDSAWIILLEVTIDQYNFRLAKNTSDVSYGGHTYQAFNFELDATKETSRGEIPTIELRVSNVTDLLHPYLEAYNGGVGGTVKITVVNSNYLSETYPSLTFDILNTVVDNYFIYFTLGAVSPLRKRFPKYRYISDLCNWEFKSVECGYSGSETSCNRTYSRCSELGNTSRYGGFLGLRTRNVKLA